MNIQSNHQFRRFIYWEDLTKEEQKDFDYLDEDHYEEFFRYKGVAYVVSSFMHYEGDKYWDGCKGDSYFSGILIKLRYNGEGVICGTYYT